MKKKKILMAYQWAVISLVICNCHAQDVSEKSAVKEARIAIAKSNSTYFHAFTKRDSSLFISLYTDDCWIMPSDAPTLCGIDAPVDFFKMTYHESGVRNGKLITTEIYGDAEEFITETGLFQFIDSKDKIVKNGTFLTLWRKTEHGWKMFRNSFSQ